MDRYFGSNINIWELTSPPVTLLPISSSYTTILGILVRSSSGGRGYTLEEIFLGGTGGANVTYDVSYFTSIGVPTTVSGVGVQLGLPSGNTPPGTTLFGNNTTEPTFVVGSSVFNVTTGGPYRYNFANSGAPIVSPGLINVGYALRAKSASYTGFVAVSLIWSEG